MNNTIVELEQYEINKISGGKEEMSSKEAICGIIGSLVGMGIVYFIVDPCLSFFRRKVE